MGSLSFRKKGTWNGAETWENAFPGFNDELRAVTDPAGLARRQARRLTERGVTNLVSGLAQPFPTWHPDDMTNGAFASEGGRATIRGPVRGCHMVQIDHVKPYDHYVVSLRVSDAKGDVSVCWQKAGAWQWHLPSFSVEFGQDGFGAVVVRVPTGADRLSVNLNATLGDGERVAFDEIAVFPWRD